METDEAEEPEISASKFQYKREMVKLSLASIPLSSHAVAAKYKIIEKDFDKYLKLSQLDMLLKHELGRSVPGFKSGKPKLADPQMNKLDKRCGMRRRKHIWLCHMLYSSLGCCR